MSKYKITGKRSLHFSLNEKGVTTEYSLHEGLSVELPDENLHVKTLTAKKIIAKDGVLEEPKKIETKTNITPII